MDWTLAFRDTTKDRYLSELKKFLVEDVKYPEVFSKFGTPRLSEIHPFAIVQAALSGGRRFPANVFPSVSIAITTENFKSQNFIGHKSIKGQFTNEILAPFKDVPIETRLYSKTTTDALQTKLDNAEVLKYSKFNYQEQGSIVISVWDTNSKAQDALYQMVKLFNEVKSEIVFEDEDWGELSWSAERDGLYNFELGRPLYGSMITVNGSRTVSTLVVTDEDVGSYDSITTPIKGLNSTEGSTYQKQS